MTSQPEGYIVVPVWSDDGDVTALVDDDGYLPVKEGTPLTSIQAQAYGYVVGAWQKQPLQFGFSDTAYELKTSTTGAAGDRTLETTVVPDDTVHVIESVAVRNVNTAAATIVIYAKVDGSLYPLLAEYSPTADQWDIWTGRATLGAGDSIIVYFYTCALNDDVDMRVCGYSMGIGD